MKYIITEDQNDRLKNYIIDYFDKNLTPYGGWKSHKEYLEELEDTSGDIFFFFEELGDEGDIEDYPHIRYYSCSNFLVSRYDCPLIVISDKVFRGLNALPVDLWKPIFIEWFQDHTKLPIKKINTLNDLESA
jgi:hypothetical protein